MSFHETCDLIRIEVDDEGTWLCCAARAVDGQENNIRFRLDDHIGNSDGYFTWDGRDFSSSARDIVLEHREDGPWLCAYLRRTDGSESERQGIRLGDRITNENGELQFI
ncbi:hypothetical protein VTN02DRAFT_5113 [Thermoascus thermophilus]